MKEYRYSAIFLSLSLLSSTVTTIRVGVVGVPEVFGLLAIILSFKKFSVLLSPSLYLTRLMVVFVIVSLLLGSAITFIFQMSSLVLRDWVAWIYIIFFIGSVVINITHSKSSLLVITRYLSWMPLFLIAIFFLGSLGAFNIWIPNEFGATIPFVSRFIGLSTNPNQIGIAISALPFVCIYYFLSRDKGLSRWFFLLCNLTFLLIICIFVASNTVIVAWVSGFFIAFLFHLRNLLTRSPFWALMFLAGILVPSFFLIEFFVPYLDKGGDVGGRSEIWKTIPEVFISSPLVGHGPGAHGGIGKPFEGWELHSVPFDLLSQGGLVLFSCFIILLLSGLFLAVKSRSSIVVAIFIATFVESLAHNAIRHPIFWFYLLFPYFLTLSTRSRQKV